MEQPHFKLRVFEKTFEGGSVIFREGDFSTELYILLEGSVEVIKGSKVIARENKRGVYLGEMSLLLGKPRSATLKAITQARFYVVPEERVYQFFNRSPEMALNLARGLARRLLMMNTKVRELDAILSGATRGAPSSMLAFTNWDAPPEEMSIADRIEYLTQTEIHRVFLHYHTVKAGSDTQIESLTARCRTSPERLLEVLKDFERFNLVRIEDDETVHLLVAQDLRFKEATEQWVKNRGMI